MVMMVMLMLQGIFDCPVVPVLTADYFSHGCDVSDNSRLRYKLCQDLWDAIKVDTEVRRRAILSILESMPNARR